MKKIVLILVVFAAALTAASVSAQVADTIVPTTPTNRNALLEVFTAVGCQHCSDGDRIANELVAANLGHVNVINIHEGSYASNTYTTQFGTALREQSNLGGYPQGTVNRHIFSGTATAMGRGEWTSKANQILATPSPVNIAAEGTLDWATRTLNVRVQLYYTTNQTVTTNSLNIAIVQDNVLGPQSGGSTYNPTQMVGDLYNHTCMLRHLITGQWGDTIPTIAQGTLVEKTYQYVIPDQFGYPNPIAAPLEDLRFIAFVCEGHQEVLTSVEIPIQMVEQPPFTIAHGGQTSSHSPIYTDNTNRYTWNQVIYPAGMLSELVGNDISAVTFYLQTPPDSALTNIIRLKVGIVNVSQFTNNSFISTTSRPASYNGTVTVAADNTLTIHFDEPYTYTGGNLLMELYTTTPGVNPTATFYGITSTNGSLYSNSPNTWNFANKILEDFIPKTTFTCVWADTCSPQNLAVSEITGSSAFLTWEPAHSTVPSHYEVSYRVAGAADWTVAAANTTDEYLLLTGLQPQTNYEVRMRALCGSSSSDYLTAAFTTECSGGTDPVSGSCISDGCDRANVAVTDITVTSALLHLTAGNGASGFELQYKRTADSTFTPLNATGSTYLLTGLRHNTEYTVRIRSLCSGSQSNWKETTFTTAVIYYTRIYASEGGTGNGGSWASATGDLNYALSTAAAIHNSFGTWPDVWVAQGTYYGDSVSADAFTMMDGINVYGGFAGNETELSQRDINAHPTILDGQHSQRVLNQPANFTQSTTWDGFIIRNGFTTGNGGGAMLRVNTNLYNCTFLDNTGANGGGAYKASTTSYNFIANCQFSGNTATSNGGGLYAERVYALRCTFTHNVANGNGGGVYLTSTSNNSPYLSNCLIANNTAANGGGLWNYQGATRIENTTIVRNLASGNGAGVYDAGPVAQMVNSIIWGNRTTSNAVSNFYKSVSSTNPKLLYNAVEGGLDGEGNITLTSANTGASLLSPRFVSPSLSVGAADTTADADWHLAYGSPCVNSGRESGNGFFVSAFDTIDLDNGPRVLHDTIDMGCYESDYSSSPTPQYGNIIYVTEQGAGTQFGDSWENATASIAEAQALAQSHNAVVWVAAGTYYGNTSSDNAFNMMEGVSVYGGFAGNEPADYDLSLRDFETNASILDGQNARRVLNQPNNFTQSTIVTWDGFTIQHGRTSGYGAGVYLRQYSTLSHCIVQNNSIYYYSSTGEAVSSYGAGVFSYISLSSTLNRPNLISDCIIRNNSFESNSSLTGRGAGLCIMGTTLLRTEISHNTTPSYGGGIYSYAYDTLSNCLIHSNSAAYGGGIYVNGGFNVYRSCDIVGNTVSSNGGGIYSNNNMFPEFTNCIIWGNHKSGTPNNSNPNIVCSYSAVEGGYDGEGNIALASENTGSDPLCPRFKHPSSFAGASNTSDYSDWRLAFGSPCVNSGTNTGADTTDLDGNNRIQKGIIDMGCYESAYDSIPPQYGNIIYVTKQGAGGQIGNSWADALSSIEEAQALAREHNAVVWVAKGTYYGNTTSYNAFSMVPGVSVYGGFAGNEPADYDLSLRDFETNTTILDGLHSRRVLDQPTNFTADSAVTWDGFTIQNGSTSGYGAGVYMMQYSTLSHCIVQNNNVYYYSSSGSSVSSYGAGVFSYITLSDGMRPNIISDCIIRNNSFEDHTSLTGRGAGLCIKGTKIIRTEISYNTCPRSYGGGLYSYADDTLSNCLVHGNNARYGAGMYIIGANNCFTNCDFVGNTVPSNGYGGGFYNNSVSPVFTNCILWGNKKDNNVSDFVYSSGNPPTLTYCAVTGGFSGTGNLNLAIANDGNNDTLLYVRLVDPANGDFQLQPTSACIDAGNSGAVDSDRDFYGNPRLNGTVDIGCYEANSNITETIEATACNSYTWNGITYTASGNYVQTFTAANGSDSVVTLHLTIHYSTHNVETETACESFVWHGQTYTTSGTYTYAYTNADGCESEDTLKLTVYPVFDTPIAAEICEGSSYSFFDTTLTTAGTYTHTLQSVHGCDSVITLTLTLKYAKTAEFAETVCESHTWNGTTYTVSGDYNQTFTAANGCDSVVTLHLTVNPTYNTPVSAEICEGSSYSFFDTTLTTAGTYTHTLQSVHGCDSVITLTLTLKHVKTAEFAETVCESYTWNSTTYTVSGDYNQTFTAANGCDSVVTLHLTVNPTYSTPVSAEICDGSSYSFFDTTLTTAGTYTHTLQSVHGCDSVIALTLTVNQPVFGVDERAVCDSLTWIDGVTYYESTNAPTFVLQAANGCDSIVTLHLTIASVLQTHIYESGCDNFTWEGTTYSASGEYTKTFTSVSGCDSVVTLHLTIHQPYQVPVAASICDGSSYVFFDTTLTTAGTYTRTLQSVSGCDSVIVLTLTVNPAYNFEYDLDICEGESLHFNGEIITESGTYTQTSQTATGCDSIVTIVLTVHPVDSTQIAAEICEGGSYDFFGQTLTSAGTYTHTLQSVIGCDSVIVLTLTEVSAYNTPVTAEICDGESYNFFGQALTTAGTYTHTLQSVHGCDSVIALTLAVNPVYNTPVTAEICDGESYNFFGQTLTTAGTYTHTLQSVHGCDSVIALTLAVNPAYNTPVAAEICDGESYNFFGQTLTTAGTYTHTLQSVHGCDSVIALTLAVNPAYNTPVTAEICDGESYNFFGQTLTTAGTYTHTLQSVHGCDSVFTLTLTVNHGTHNVETETACESFTWHGTTYTTSGTYTYAYTNANGCASVDTLHLTVSHGTHNVGTETACESFTWHGETYTTSGTYTYAYTNANGCASVDTLHLTVSHGTHNVGTETACESFTWHGTTYTTSGTYTYAYTNANGCASVDTLHLTVSHGTHNVETETACESFSWHGTTYTTSGTYTYAYNDANGCASVDTLYLTVNHGTHNVETETACESFTWHGETYTTSGTYTYAYNNASGCASVDTLHLTVNHGTHNVETETACESFTWHGETYTTSGTYTYAYNNASGCASVDTLHLTVNYGTHNVETETACESFLWHGETYTTSGTYTYAYNNDSGCASVDTLYLTVNYSATSDFTITTTDSCYEWNSEIYCESGDYTQTLQTVSGCDSVVTLHLTITVGIDDHDLSNIELFPNPTNRILNIRGGDMQRIDIYSADGQLVYTKEGNGSDLMQVDVSQFAAGQYFVKVQFRDSQTVSRKIIVNRP